MNEILIIILLVLILTIGGFRGLKSSLSLLLNFILLMITFYFVAIGINPIITTLIGCGVISYIILFFVVGKNIKTINSFKAIILSLAIITVFIFLIAHLTNIGGFGIESYEEINMFSYDININMLDISISLILIGLIGAIIDSSIAISSALYELYENNQSLTESELYASGLNIGKDILGTTINTLLFAFLGESMALLFWFESAKYGMSDIINSKIFCVEIIKIVFIGIGSILVIPITAKIMANKLIKNSYFNQ